VDLTEKATVKAVVIHAPGAPEQLVMADAPEPEPGPGEALVDVAFAGCNWADTQIRTGIYPHARTYPLVLGLEVAGTVAKLGAGVSGVKIGGRLAAFLEHGGAYAQKAVVAAKSSKLPPRARYSAAFMPRTKRKLASGPSSISRSEAPI
jgi:NADPH:quinone reductase